MTDFSANFRGILAMLGCCLFFILNDTMVKAAGERLPLGQIIAIRGIIGTAGIFLIAWRMGLLAGLHRQVDRWIAWRTLGEVGATFLYLTALMHMPIANISSIAQAAPLAITAAGALFLGETVGWRRWTAVMVGFAGILVIVRPGADGFNVWALLALGSVGMIVLRDLVTRAIPASTSAISIAAITSAAVTVFGFALGIAEDWRPVGGTDLALMAGAALFLLLGYLTVVVAMRSGDVSLVAPFRYAFIPYAIVIGWVVWGDVPDAVTLAGIAIVVGTGVYTFHRERKAAGSRGLARASATAPSPQPGGG